MKTSDVDGDAVNVSYAWYVDEELVLEGAGEDTLEFLAVLSPADSGEPMTVDRSGEEPWCSLRS